MVFLVGFLTTTRAEIRCRGRHKLAEQGTTGSGHTNSTSSVSGSLDLPLAIYALLTGILTVSGGTLFARLTEESGIVSRLIPPITSIAFAAVCTFFADFVLAWLLPIRRQLESSHHP